MNPAEEHSSRRDSLGSDDVLSAYVMILAGLRRARPGKPFAFRADDLSALTADLGFDPEHVEARIAGTRSAAVRPLNSTPQA